MADVFISYRRRERARVAILAERLQDRGFSVWFDSQLDPGNAKGFDVEIELELNSCSAVLVCWTMAALSSPWVRGEAMKGLESNKLVPIFLEQVPLPVPFNVIHTTDLSDFSAQGENSSFDAVVKKLSEFKKVTSAEANDRSAYLDISAPMWPGVLSELINRPKKDWKERHWPPPFRAMDDVHAMAKYIQNFSSDLAYCAESLLESAKPDCSMQIYDLMDDVELMLKELDEARTALKGAEVSFVDATSLLAKAPRSPGR